MKKEIKKAKKSIKNNKKTILIVLDGWGLKKTKKFNAIKLSKHPFFDSLWKEHPHTELYAAEEHVGLPKGFIGNSEVGHTHLGAGRIIPQELKHINKKIKNKSFFKNKEILSAMNNCIKQNAELHLMGLLSDGGVHSHIDHLFALLKLAKKKQVNKVSIHCFLDGRDTPQKSALKYIKKTEKFCKKLGIGKIATVTGRYYAMDRDNRWNREHKAYDAMVNGKGLVYSSASEAVKSAYKRGETDEFVKPSIIFKENKKTKEKTRSKTKKLAYVSEHESIIFFNFREDRARELTKAFVEGKFNKFKRKKVIDLHFVCLTQYDKSIKVPVAFPPEVPKKTLGEIISKKDFKQLRIAETEKYAHVTYFFNGGRDGPFKNEDRFMIPSPRVSTYDKTPGMSASKISKETVKRIKSKKYDLIVLNFANPDMVGHSGDLNATIKALSIVDKNLKKVVTIAKENKYNILITADHGNAEDMAGKHKTTHTTNKVPLIIISNKNYSLIKRKSNSIANISPTILKLLGIKAPKEYIQPLIK